MLRSDMDGALSFALDTTTGIIRVKSSGLCTAAQMRAHFEKLDQILRGLRIDHGIARVLVDLREAPVQTRETAAAMNDGVRRAFRVRDRVAILCSTTLLAMQVKRERVAFDLATFRDCRDAMLWLDGRLQDCGRSQPGCETVGFGKGAIRPEAR